MENNNPLENEEIIISGFELVEKTTKDGSRSWKEYKVKVPNAPRGTYYTLPIHKVDGSETKAYEVYKQNKLKLEEYFIDNKQIKAEIAYSERVAEQERDGVKNIYRYRTIRAMKIVAVAPISIDNSGTNSQPSVEVDNPPEIDIEDIPF